MEYLMKRNRKQENIKRLKQYLVKRANDLEMKPFTEGVKKLQKRLEDTSTSGYKMVGERTIPYRTIYGIEVDNMYKMLDDVSPEIEHIEQYFILSCEYLTKLARSKGKMGVKQTETHRLNNSLSKRGIKKTDEQKSKISNALKGNDNFKRNLDEERKKKHSEVMKKYYQEQKKERKSKLPEKKTMFDFLNQTEHV